MVFRVSTSKLTKSSSRFESFSILFSINTAKNSSVISKSLVKETAFFRNLSLWALSMMLNNSKYDMNINIPVSTIKHRNAENNEGLRNTNKPQLSKIGRSKEFCLLIHLDFYYRLT